MLGKLDSWHHTGRPRKMTALKHGSMPSCLQRCHDSVVFRSRCEAVEIASETWAGNIDDRFTDVQFWRSNELCTASKQNPPTLTQCQLNRYPRQDKRRVLAKLRLPYASLLTRNSIISFCTSRFRLQALSGLCNTPRSTLLPKHDHHTIELALRNMQPST